jgi:hypothetical protein
MLFWEARPLSSISLRHTGGSHFSFLICIPASVQRLILLGSGTGVSQIADRIGELHSDFLAHQALLECVSAR